MAKIKGWEKSIGDSWISKDKNTNIIIEKDLYLPQRYTVRFQQKSPRRLFIKGFKNKELALKFVIDYMKTHPNG